MSFQLNLAALTESARDRLARLESPGTSLRGRLFSPGLRGSAPSASASTPLDSSGPPAPRVVGFGSTGVEVGSSGEFSFSAVSGGGSTLPVFVMTAELSESLCLGSVSNGIKFCTLGRTTCSIKAHTKKISVQDGTLYIAGIRNTAFVNHTLPLSLLSTEQLTEVLGEQHTQEEWAQLFLSFKDSVQTPTKNRQQLERGLISALKPSKRVKLLDVTLDAQFDEVPDLQGASSSSADSSDSTLVILSSVDTEDLSPEEKIGVIASQWDTLVNNFTKLQRSIASLRNSSRGDMESLDLKISSMDARIGRPQAEFFEDCISSWDGLQALLNLSEVNSATSNATQITITELRSKLNAFEAAQQSFHSEVMQGFAEVSSYAKMMNEEHSSFGRKLKTLEDLVGASGLTDFSVTRDNVNGFNSRLIRLENMLQQSDGIGPNGSELVNLKTQMRLLEARIPMHSIFRLGGQVFQSKADLALFVETKIPSNTFSLFYDSVTLMERLSGSFVERKEVLTEWYQADKVGLNEQEARHMASFKITFPTVFGQVKGEGSGTAVSKYHLPAVKSFKDWNAYDGESGIKKFILDGLYDLKQQFLSDVSSVLDHDQWYDARVMAVDMHAKSDLFVTEMCGWMDSFHHELMHTSEATEDEAWELVSSCIKRIFEDLRRVRASAANAAADISPTSKCTTILWALIQSHKVMREFLDMRFRNHPSTRVTRVTYSNKVKSIEGRITKLEGQKNQNNQSNNKKDSEKRN